MIIGRYTFRIYFFISCVNREKRRAERKCYMFNCSPAPIHAGILNLVDESTWNFLMVLMTLFVFAYVCVCLCGVIACLLCSFVRWFVCTSMFLIHSASINDFIWLNVICINLFSQWEHYHSVVLSFFGIHTRSVPLPPPLQLLPDHSRFQIGRCNSFFSTFKYRCPFPLQMAYHLVSFCIESDSLSIVTYVYGCWIVSWDLHAMEFGSACVCVWFFVWITGTLNTNENGIHTHTKVDAHRKIS